MGIVCGVGTSSNGKYLISIGGKPTKGYNTWKHMLNRCYGEKYKAKKPTYVGCHCSEGFLDFQTFMLWAEKQVGFGNEGWELDKDVLVKGNKLYSEDTCVFLPKCVNTLFCKKDANRGRHVIGVYYSSRLDKYIASVQIGAVNTYLGCHATEVSAFTAYKSAKEAAIKEMAERYKDTIDQRAYLALFEYEVMIGD